MASKDSHLYGLNQKRNLNNGKEISSSSSLSFTSQLSSLITASSSQSTSRTSSGRSRPKKEDIFAKHNRNSLQRAKRDREPDIAGNFEQKHSTKSEALDNGVWERSKRKMEEKARLYAAMKRGDVEDADEKYAVDFDAKWAAARADGKDDDDEDDEDLSEGQHEEQVEFLDEFGRTRKGTRLDAMRARQQIERQSDSYLSAKPAAPSNIIYGDTIQHEAFNPDASVAAQMEELARKRDKSLTPPPEEHFDGRKEVRRKGTGFFQFSDDADERKRQMGNLEQERAETVRRRNERLGMMNERKAKIDARRLEIQRKNAKRKADEFLSDLGMQIDERTGVVDKAGDSGNVKEQRDEGDDMAARIEAAVQREKQDDE